MQDEYILRMSQYADTEINDVPTINILLCYLLYKSENKISSDDLYEIAVSSGMINYFSYQESVDHLIKNNLIEIKDSICTLLENGIYCAKTLKNYTLKSQRDNIILTSLRYFNCEKLKKEFSIEYEAIDKGCYVCVRCKDKTHDLMNLKLFAPDMKQAKLIGDKINLNPAGFYKSIMNLVLFSKEVGYDLSDN